MRVALSYGAKYPYVRAWANRELTSRPAHHGYKHALEVSHLAAKIARPVLSPAATGLTKVVGILHDVDDYKTASAESSLRLSDMLLRTGGPAVRQIVLDIIKYISFTRELNRGRDGWDALPAEGLLIRNIVSDADKLLSLGTIGYRRLYEYNIQKHPVDYVHQMELVIERRLKLVPTHMHTSFGKKYASAELDVLLREYENFRYVSV